MSGRTSDLPVAANDDLAETELEAALNACPGPGSGMPWWQHRRHLVMMDYGRRRDQNGNPTWPQAAEYVRHQDNIDQVLQDLAPDPAPGRCVKI